MTATGTRLPTVAVVLAGGTGARVGAPMPKQLLQVGGRTVLEHTVEALHDCAAVDEVLVVMAAGHLREVEALLPRSRYPKLTRVLPGGADRHASTRRALDALGERECDVLFHDAARPLVPRRVVQECVDALQTCEAVLVAVPSTDTVVSVADGRTVTGVPDRRGLWRAQTPQGFRLSVVRRAYEIAGDAPGLDATDNCGVVLRALPNVAIRVVQGDEQNLKVTVASDVVVVDALLQARAARPARAVRPAPGRPAPG